ncbi:non-ribosomal peptide synthetase [Secundilactobacillus oryzae JCM 18671]|uniref:Non-ribosomal peptide synthetase n=1 Tax=Secundilactobacillus oryzae JCM 18671 TaxID=1291743 RepID=A0A081BI45_9LACO|nr:DUF4054 domain-containing protein [Secundilactobacillus oryzae]GAK47713.1 non-ribosomal peptide synthetase [Secundilactobacillus oryzae JCM 18671]
MIENLKETVQKKLTQTYPELFDDESANNKLDLFIRQAEIKCRSYNVSDDDMETLVTLFVAHLLHQSEQADGVATSVKADVFQVNLSDTNGTDVYFDQFNDMLNALGLNDGWKVQFL